jgi:hypothetical protein
MKLVFLKEKEIALSASFMKMGTSSFCSNHADEANICCAVLSQ